MEQFSAERPVGIIGAMEVEVEELVGVLEGAATLEAAGTVFHTGVLDGLDVVVVQSGIGKVGAAATAQALVDRFGVAALINTGIAGALAPGLDQLDVVVSRDACYHDFDLSAWGYPLGQVPGVDGIAFTADAQLVEAALESVHEVAPESEALVGRVASGDRFVGDLATKHTIADTFDAACCEMEGAPIAHVACRNGIPFVIVRTISDAADGDASVLKPEFEQRAAHLCAAVVRSMCAKLA